MQNFYVENHKTHSPRPYEELNKQREMFIDWENQDHKDYRFPQFKIYMQWNPCHNHNANKAFCIYMRGGHTDKRLLKMSSPLTTVILFYQVVRMIISIKHTFDHGTLLLKIFHQFLKIPRIKFKISDKTHQSSVVRPGPPPTGDQGSPMLLWHGRCLWYKL